MSDAVTTDELPGTDGLPGTDELLERYAPLFARIAEGAVARERERVLPYEQIGWIKESGFLGLRVPPEFGGGGATLPQLFRLLVELAAADPHIPQALRGHIGFVEDRLCALASPARDAWLRRFVHGELVGNGVTEIGSVVLGATNTRLASDGDDWQITGSKYYTTGSIFADWIDATAVTPDGIEVAALVSTASDRVVVSDDWAGFGQRLTGSGTAVFDAAPVAAEQVFPFSERFFYQTSLYQLVLVAVQAGIAKAVERDAVLQVTTRSRAFSHGNSPLTREDPQILEIVGRISVDAFTAEAAVEHAAGVLQHAYEVRGDAALVARVKEAAELASARAQIVVTEVSLRAATQLFDALGASATSTSVALDRHWRNARTVASHNPTAFKARIVGDNLVNQTEPPYEWYVGVGQKK